MKVVVTGGAGYVGTVLTGHLLAQGHQVVAFDNLLYGGQSLLGFTYHPAFLLVKGDIRDQKRAAEAFAGAQAVVHLAAIVGEPACSADEPLAWSVNCEGTETILAAARAASVKRCVYVSTCSNYGVSLPGELADETTPLRPISHYARSKVQAEQYVLDSTGDISTVVLRFGTICGLSGRMRFDLLVSELARDAVLQQPIEIFAPDAWRPFLHIRDAARAVELCLGVADQLVRRMVFNVVGENYQKKHLADLVRKHFPSARIGITEKQADLRDYRASSRLIERQLGFETRFRVEDAFLETASAVAAGVFFDPRWAGHSAIPLTAART